MGTKSSLTWGDCSSYSVKELIWNNPFFIWGRGFRLLKSTTDENQVLLDMRQMLQVTQLKSWYETILSSHEAEAAGYSTYADMTWFPLWHKAEAVAWLLKFTLDIGPKSLLDMRQRLRIFLYKSSVDWTPVSHSCEVKAAYYSSTQLILHEFLFDTRRRLCLPEWIGPKVPPWDRAEASDYLSLGW